VHQSHKTLDTHKSIIGKQDKQYQQLLEKSEKITKLATNSQLNKRQSWLAYSYYYIPAMSYSLTAISMSQAQLVKIQQNRNMDHGLIKLKKILLWTIVII
jgi:hypothetical protein